MMDRERCGNLLQMVIPGILLSVPTLHPQGTLITCTYSSTSKFYPAIGKNTASLKYQPENKRLEDLGLLTNEDKGYILGRKLACFMYNSAGRITSLENHSQLSRRCTEQKWWG